MKKRWMSLLLIALLCLGIFAPTAMAEGEIDEVEEVERELQELDEEPELVEETSSTGLLATASIRDGDNLYLGMFNEHPICWLVLDAEATNTGEDGLFLLTKEIMKMHGLRFGEEAAVWTGSKGEKWCKSFFKKAFAEEEKKLVPTVSKTEEPFVAFGLDWKGTEMTDDRVFFLSARELFEYMGQENGTDGFTAFAYDYSLGYWWLRTLRSNGEGGIICEANQVLSSPVTKAWGSRPAMNLKADGAYFASPARDRSLPGSVIALTDGTIRDWKLTLPDESRTLSLDAASLEDGILTLAYSGAMVGALDYVSFLAADAEGRPLYYGKLLQPQAAEGEVQIDLGALELPEGFGIYLFSEQVNGDYRTNYAGPLCRVSFTLSFDAGEGSGEMDALTAPLGTAVELPENAFQARYGRDFDHWEIDGVPVTGSVTISGDCVATAVYTAAKAKEIVLDKPVLALPLFESITVSAQVLPEGSADSAVSWSTDSEIISISDLGDGSCSVEAKSPGAATITVTTGSGRVRTEIPVTVTGSSSMAQVANYSGLLILAAAILAAILMLMAADRYVNRRLFWDDWDEE